MSTLYENVTGIAQANEVGGLVRALGVAIKLFKRYNVMDIQSRIVLLAMANLTLVIIAIANSFCYIRPVGSVCAIACAAFPVVMILASDLAVLTLARAKAIGLMPGSEQLAAVFAGVGLISSGSSGPITIVAITRAKGLGTGSVWLKLSSAIATCSELSHWVLGAAFVIAGVRAVDSLLATEERLAALLARKRIKRATHLTLPTVLP